jgi:hypothetical protein
MLASDADRDGQKLVDQLKDDWRRWAERLTPPRE